MTNVTEAKLAREAGVCYTTVALVTDYDCWHEDEESVTVEAVLEIMHKNVALAQAIIKEAVTMINLTQPCACHVSGKHAIVTDRTFIPEHLKKGYEILFGNYL